MTKSASVDGEMDGAPSQMLPVKAKHRSTSQVLDVVVDNVVIDFAVDVADVVVLVNS